MAAKENCWEYKNCGREPGGIHVHDEGVCPATEEVRLNGVHGGWNAGRCCWVVAGTFCGGKIQGSFASKFHDCKTCDFYLAVQDEELPEFVFSSVLLTKLK